MAKVNNINQISNIANKTIAKDAVVEFEENLKKSVEKLKDRVMREITDTGYFRGFAEDFKNTNNPYSNISELLDIIDKILTSIIPIINIILTIAINLEFIHN